MTNNIEHHRGCFINYLKKTRHMRNVESDILHEFVIQIEIDITTICEQYNIHKTNIYEIVNKEWLLSVKNELFTNGQLANLHNETHGRIRESVDLYIGFLKSKYHPLAEGKLKEYRPTNQNFSSKKGPESAGSNVDKKKISLKEGGKLQVRDSEIYNRNPKAREECIKAYKSEYKCIVCEMNFVETYGELGKEFIEVHHLFPISQTDEVHDIDPAKDLIPLCSNCHSMIHRLEDPSDWQGLKVLFESSRNT